MAQSSEAKFTKAANRPAFEDATLRSQLTEERRRQWDDSKKREVDRIAEAQKRQNESRRLDNDKEKSRLEKWEPTLRPRGAERNDDPGLPAREVQRRYSNELAQIRSSAHREREQILQAQGISRDQFKAEREGMSRLKAQKKLDNEKTRERGR